MVNTMIETSIIHNRFSEGKVNLYKSGDQFLGYDKEEDLVYGEGPMFNIIVIRDSSGIAWDKDKIKHFGYKFYSKAKPTDIALLKD